MMKMIGALSEWLAQFGTFYAENDVPDEAALPYGTVPLVEPEWNQNSTFYIRWYVRTTDSTMLIAKADEIVGAIGSGIRIPFEGGILVIWPETPLIQQMIDGDVRSVYINLSIRSMHTPGI